MGGVKPIHHDPRRVDELNGELLKSGALGAFRGALIGASTSLVLMLISPTFRAVRTPVKVYYNAVWISCGTVWWAEKQVLSFEARVAQEESVRRAKILDEAAERGIYLEDDKRSLDDGLYR